MRIVTAIMAAMPSLALRTVAPGLSRPQSAPESEATTLHKCLLGRRPHLNRPYYPSWSALLSAVACHMLVISLLSPSCSAMFFKDFGVRDRSQCTSLSIHVPSLTKTRLLRVPQFTADPDPERDPDCFLVSFANRDSGGDAQPPPRPNIPVGLRVRVSIGSAGETSGSSGRTDHSKPSANGTAVGGVAHDWELAAATVAPSKGTIAQLQHRSFVRHSRGTVSMTPFRLMWMSRWAYLFVLRGRPVDSDSSDSPAGSALGRVLVNITLSATGSPTCCCVLR